MSTHDVLIRNLTQADLPAVARINNANVPAVGEADEAKLAHISAESVVTLVATPADTPEEVIGFCLVLEPGADYHSVNYKWFEANMERFVYLDRVALDDEWQGKGIGPLLYREVESRVDADHFCLEVNLRPRNDGSLRFHEREGFTEVGQLETDYGNLVSLLAKPLR